MEQTHTYFRAPGYRNQFCQRIGVLQQIQTVLSDQATLEDLAQFVRNLQKEFGEQELLEDVIQSLVSCALEEQVAQRKRVTVN